MIWFLIFGLCVGVFIYLAAPLYSPNANSQTIESSIQEEVSAYRDELRKIEKDLISGNCDIAALTTEKLILEKRLIKSVTPASHLSSGRKTVWIVGVFAVLTVSTLGIYGVIGSPQLTDTAAIQPAVLSTTQALSQIAPKTQHENDATIEDLIAGLEKKLDADNQNPQKWGLYARSLMTVNRFEEAFSAYEKTLSLTDNNPEILAELENARAFAAQQSKPVRGQTPPTTQSPGPNREDIEAAAQMSNDDRSEMIQGMVEGLSLKLAENPDDLAGWVRLLRARQVLGQSQAAEKEILSLKAHFKDDPQIVSEVLNLSGWSN